MDHALTTLLQELVRAGITIQVRNGQLLVGPPPVPPELAARIRAARTALLAHFHPENAGEVVTQASFPHQDAENKITSVSPPGGDVVKPRPEITTSPPPGDFGGDFEIRVTTRKTASHHHITTDSGEKHAHTSSRTDWTARSVRDPLVEDTGERQPDSAYWERLFARLVAENGLAEPLGVLRFLRRLGAQLTNTGETLKLVPPPEDELSAAEYAEIRTEWLLPHRQQLMRLFQELAKGV